MRTRRLNPPCVPNQEYFAARFPGLSALSGCFKRLTALLGLPAVAAGLFGFIASSQAAITGQWSFESGDIFFSAKIGQSMDYRDTAETPFDTFFGTTASFGIANINGQSVAVMQFPATIPSGGFTVPHSASANGGGANVNQYTIIMDVYYPSSSSGKPRALFQTDVTAGNPESEFYIDSQNRIGTSEGFFSGTATVTPDAWHRVAFAVDLTIPSVAKFIDGVKVDESDPGAGKDGRWSINGPAMYFDSDDTNNPTQTALGYLSSMQFRDERADDALLIGMGAPTPDGIPTGPLPNPYVSNVTPSPKTVIIPARSTVPPKPLIQATIVDGTNAVNPNPATITMTLNGQSVTPLVNKAGNTTTIGFTPSTLLAPLSLDTVQITYKGLDSTAYTAQWQFVVGSYTLIPPGDPAGSANTPGFVVRTVQAPAAAVAGDANPVLDNLSFAIRQLDGTLTDTGGVLVANVAIPGPNPDGSYSVDTINFHLGGTSYGFFTGDSPFPGIPGSEGGSDVFSSEILTYLQLSAGTHHLGFSVTVDRTDTASDDGYTLFSGTNPRNFLAPVLGAFFRGNVPAFSSVNNSNVFTIVAPADGIYPMRLTYWQTHEDASLEWFSLDEASGDKILINDPADARSIKAFQVSTAASENKPYVVQIDPTPGISGVSPLLPVTVLVIDDQTQLALNSIQLSLNGSLIPSAAVTATKSNGRTTITYQPNATRTVVTNVWHLVYSDNGSPARQFTNDWQFSIAVNTGISTPVAGQWDFNNCDLSATVGNPLRYFDGPSGQTAAGTVFGTCSSLGVSLINGVDARIMQVPGAIGSQYGYTMDHGIAPNGGGHLVNQYTIIFDIMVDDHSPDGSGAASLIQISSPTLNNDDGDLFWQGNNFGQGGGGYNGRSTFTTKAWHRVVAAYDEAASPPVVTKYVDGIKQDDWTANQGLDAPRRALQPTAILFGEGDGDERRVWWVSSVQIRSGKMTDAQIAAMGGPSASKIPIALPSTSVAGQWDFQFGDLSATVGQPLQYFDGPAGQTVAGTVYGTCSSLGVSLINGVDAKIMQVPGANGSQYGYIMNHGISPNGGGSKVNQYTLIFDLMVSNCCEGAASLIQISSPTLNNDDGDLFWQGNNFGQGGGGYNGHGTFTPMAWHRVVAAYDEAASPPVVTKYVDGIKQDDWTANQGLDAPRRALQPTAILFGEGDGDERRTWWVSSIQISAGKMPDAEIAALGGPSANKIPVGLPPTTVAGQWDFEFGDLSATVGKSLQYFDGPAGQTVAGTAYGNCSTLGVPLINGVDAKIMQVPGANGGQFGYIMTHGIPPNGGGHLVNQYTLVFDLMISNCCEGAASLIQISSPTLNNDDGDLFWQGNNFGQGGGGYNGTGAFTPMAWHRVIAAYDEAAHPPVVTKFVDGIKQDDWTSNQALDAPRRALQPTAILFGEGDGDERRVFWVDSIQIRAGKLSDADMIALGGPSGTGIPIVVPAPAPALPAAKITVQRSGNTLRLTWPLELAGYVLESTPSFGTPNWQPVAGTTANCASIAANTGNHFYRLHHP